MHCVDDKSTPQARQADVVLERAISTGICVATPPGHKLRSHPLDPLEMTRFTVRYDGYVGLLAMYVTLGGPLGGMLLTESNDTERAWHPYI